jgi:hypothetical protein
VTGHENLSRGQVLAQPLTAPGVQVEQNVIEDQDGRQIVYLRPEVVAGQTDSNADQTLLTLGELDASRPIGYRYLHFIPMGPG